MAKIKIEKHDSVKMYRIRKTLDEISDKTGHGTELITVYIPKGKQLHEVISILKEEQGTADNIKSDFTRSHVVDSLGKVIQRLKMYKKTPERGLVVFCGALPPEGGGPIGSEVVRAYEIDPPKDLKTFLYRCDDHFHVDILKDMLKDDNLIGFLAIDAKDAGWGLLHGDRIDVLSETGSGVAGKHRQGGNLKDALRSMLYFHDIYPYLSSDKRRICHQYRLHASYAGSEGVREAFDKAGNILSNFRLVEEKSKSIRVISLLKTFNCTHK